MIEVLQTGPRCLIQDLGRPGLASLGVAPSGALDPLMLRRANALVGNSIGAAGLEVLLGECVLVARTACAVAVVGGSGPETSWLSAGEELRVRAARALAYVAARGGIGATPVLGSCSTDLLSGLGPPPVRAGDVLGLGRDTGPAEPLLPRPVPGSTIHMLPGPRPEQFPADALARFCAASWQVSDQVDRTGLRLTGSAIARGVDEAAPEGLVTGAIQVPPSGQPIVLLADRPLTGGYPVLGVVAADDLRHLVQLLPGDAVRFRA